MIRRAVLRDGSSVYIWQEGARLTEDVKRVLMVLVLTLLYIR